MSRRPLPDKLFFRIGEVAKLVGVKPHVLRYWEEELGAIEPMKTRGAHRQYRRRDVETALRIREMLQTEGLTMGGVKRRLREEAVTTAPVQLRVATLDPSRDGELRMRAALVEIRQELLDIATRLASSPASVVLADEGEPLKVKVNAAAELDVEVEVEVPARRRRE